MTPAFTTLYQQDRQELRQLYGRVFRSSAWLMAAGSLAVIVLAPIASAAWLQRTDTTYWLYVALLAVAFYFNVLGIPGYLLGMASGRMRNNVIATVLTLVALIIFGLAAGTLFGGTATVATSAVAVGACGIAVWLTNRHLLFPRRQS
jgi:O-antigen/teichoic acid export membrane protein